MSRHERWGSLCHFCEESWPCETVTLRDENAKRREQADALAAALAEVFRETEHINTRRGSRNGRIREVAEAAHRVAAKKYDVTEQFHNIAEQLGPPDHEPCGTCDWGGCDEEVVRWRYSDEIGTHLPVCFAHSLEAENARLREQAEALATALEDFRTPVWLSIGGEHNVAVVRVSREVYVRSRAALRAYREASHDR